MIIPKTIQLPTGPEGQNRSWKIIFSTRFPGTRGQMGRCDYHTQTILIKKGLNPQDVCVTLIHEIIHALFPPDVVSQTTEEIIVESLDSTLKDALYSMGLLTTQELFPHFDVPGESKSKSGGSKPGNSKSGGSKYFHGDFITAQKKKPKR